MKRPPSRVRQSYRVTLAPTPDTAEEIHRLPRSIRGKQFTSNMFPVGEFLNNRNLITARPSRIKSDTVHPILSERKQPATNTNTTVRKSPMSTGIEVEDPQKWVADRIVGHRTEEDTEYLFSKIKKKIFWMRGYGLNSPHGTFEIIQYIPRSEVISYYHRSKRSLPQNINDDWMGWDLHTSKTTQNGSVIDTWIIMCKIASSNQNKEKLFWFCYQLRARPIDISHYTIRRPCK